MSDDSDWKMSMMYAILNGFKLNPDFYSCPAEYKGKGIRHPFYGFYLFISGAIFMILYIPCILVISQKSLLKSSSYKIMLLLAIFDVLSLFINSFVTGYLSMNGINFCDSPFLLFSFASTGLPMWLGGCAICLILAVNRCCDLNQSLKIRWIFVENRTWVLLFFVILYSLYGGFFTKLPLFNSNLNVWLFNPMNGSDNIHFTNWLHSINNLVTAIFATSIYAYLCVNLSQKTQHVSSSAKISRTQRNIFIQSVIICGFNAIAAYFYVYAQFFLVSPSIIIYGHIAWQLSNGTAPLVYICMNQTIQQGVRRLMGAEKMMSTTSNNNNKNNAANVQNNCKTSRKSTSGHVF